MAAWRQNRKSLHHSLGTEQIATHVGFNLASFPGSNGGESRLFTPPTQEPGNDHELFSSLSPQIKPDPVGKKEYFAEQFCEDPAKGNL